MKRYPHYWWPARGKYYPTRIAVIDCDTAPEAGITTGKQCAERVTAWHLLAAEMRAGVVVRKASRHGEEADYIWPLLSSFCSSREQTWVFLPHAYRLLTALGFWDRLEDGRMELAGKDWKTDRGNGNTGEDKVDGLCVIEDPPTLISCRPAGKAGKLLLLDVRNYGIEPADPFVSCHVRAAYYLAGICDIVSTLRKGTPVSLRGTAASQAVQALRTRHDCVRLHCHTDVAALALERAAYHGGRCECYRLGDIPGPVYHVDVRSMYPALCLTLPIPVSIRSYHEGERSARATGEGRPSDCAADVTLRCDVPAFPLRRRGQTVYPVGVYRTYLCGPELQRAVEQGDIVRWHACAEYTCVPYLRGFFGDGLEMLEAARARGNAFLCQWIKRVMNALPGKFGEPGRRWIPIPSRTERGPYGQWTEPGPDGADTRYRNIAWNTQRLETHGESYNSIPAIAGWITSAARVRLWDYHQAAGRENVWYTDTDALLTNQAGYDGLLRAGFIREWEAGYLRTLGCYSGATIHGIRHYQLGDTVVCAGVPRGAIGAGETRADYWQRIRGATEIALGFKPGTADRGERQSRPEPYRHGVVGEGGRVTPFQVDDG